MDTHYPIFTMDHPASTLNEEPSVISVGSCKLLPLVPCFSTKHT
uniref:Uncharacterized protein n=1 Tax=Anguilla anguilla TaxID=7936 RepID=A0A0E9T537_ANGAN